MNLKEQNLAILPYPLLDWYDKNHRILPWREEISAYRTWVSEIMLQQTRVSAVIPYFERFMEKYPSVEALADSEEDELLSLWQGLGYYSRARNLKKAAQIVKEIYHGKMPDTYEELIKLPGIGDYTAGAILSIAYGQCVPAVDGNVLRVASRIADFEENILDEKNRLTIRQWMTKIMPTDRPGEFNQAIMDLGAMVCLPKQEPECDKCPAKEFCQAHLKGIEGNLPVRIKNDKKKTEKLAVFVFKQDGKIALQKRPEHGLLANMWQLPNCIKDAEEYSINKQIEKWHIQPLNIENTVSGRHVFSHIIWEMDVYFVTCDGDGESEWVWCDAQELESKALPTAFRKFLKE